jgi:predicted PurR-regulated permease PerM
LLHAPVDIRSASLAILAVLACLFAIQWARPLLVPILFGIMLSYALSPIVNRLARRRIPRGVAAGFVIALLVAGVSWGTWALRDEGDALIDLLPQVTQKVRDLSRGLEPGSWSAISKVQRAATEIQASAEGTDSAASGGSAPARTPAVRDRRDANHAAALPSTATGATHVIVENPVFDVRGYLVAGSIGALELLGQVAITVFVALFLLASGNTFRRKVVKLAGPTLSQKKISVETMEEITEQIQRYLLVQAALSLIVGVATGVAFFALGLQQAGAWGAVAAVTNLIPYLGAIVVGAGSGLVAVVQFGTIDMGLIVAATSMAIHAIVGNILTPWWMGRASRMSPFVVFVTVLAFGWLWGVSGLLLGVPILLVIKSICDRVEQFKAVGELLGA